MRHADLATLAHLNMVHAFGLLPPHQPAGVVSRHDGVLVAVTGSPIPLFNEVLPIEEHVEPGALAEAVRAVRAAGVPWVLHLRGDVHGHLAPAASDLGLEEVDVFYPAMVLSDVSAGPKPATDLEVRRTVGSDGYEPYLTQAASVTGADPELWRSWLGPGLLDDADVAALIGCVDGEVVAKSMSIRTGTVVGIYDVGTSEAARRRGYGWAMTHAALMAGAEAGASTAILQSSEMGFPIYAAHGFQTVFHYRRFREPEG